MQDVLRAAQILEESLLSALYDWKNKSVQVYLKLVTNQIYVT